MTVLVLNDTRVDQHHGCFSVMGAIDRFLRLKGFDDLQYWPAHTDPSADPAFDAALSIAKLVLINGEGTIHHDRPAGKVLLRAGLRAKLADVPVALINVGWEANGPDMVAMLETFDLVSARDNRSAEQMRAQGAKVRIVPDLSLALPKNFTDTPVHERVGVGVTDNVDRLKALGLDRIRRACGGDTLAIVHGDPKLSGLMQFVRGGISMRQDTLRPTRIAALMRLRYRLWRRGTADSTAFLHELSRLELLISGRFHACTLALALGTPVIAQSSNTGKIASLFRDAGLESWRCKGPLGPSEIEAARQHGWSDLERENIALYRQRAVDDADRLFTDIAKLVQS